jgi:hypothetical protein
VEAQPADSKLRSQLVATLFQSWAQTDPLAMLDWASQREGMAKSAWAQMLLENSYWIPVPEYADSRLRDFFISGGEKEVKGLLSLLENAPACEQQVIAEMPDDMEIGVTGVMNRWLAYDPEAASEWVTDLPAGKKRDHAAADVARWSYEAGDFEAALKWDLELPAATRDSLMPSALDSLRKEDPAKAESMIRDSSLTPAEKQKYLDGSP